ncbi:MAG: LysR family transcriptional regulator [Hydrogenophaga sp.]|jgi:DNA-binding transcriptional LysR family regulator|uniref:LysR family transcriptional regulator n=1 Tax=Hydrogenophaga sp. TaxID=1904254 RepID=UPI001D3DC817|nr:LysR family transcriptional regulator [Hydrogenophaga sp.]MBW0169870.1 LysR family transcriptional regulator [Hydrogenophaga sp.]MBW0185868.1 LysR family transcriptional regulator [Hydrogenophaga sp.]
MNHTDLQLDWLRAFVAVVDGGSLSAAAPMLHRSQPAVSMQIRKLEDAVGRAVLLRGPRHLALTPTGTELLGYARRMLALHHETLEALHGPVLSGRVRLGVPDDYAGSYLTPVLRSYANRHAGVEIELHCEQSTSLIPKVQRGEIDVALISRDKATRGTLLFQEPLVWVGSPQFEVWRRDPLPIAVYEATSLARRAVIAALSAQRRAYRVVYNSSSLAGQLAAVESGLALAVLTRCSAPAHLSVLGERQGLPALEAMDVALYRSQASRHQPAVDALFEQMVQTLSLKGRGSPG